MTLLWINLAIVFTLAYLSRYYSSTIGVPTGFVSEMPIKPNRFLIFGAMLSIVLISGLRSNIGDTYFYMHAYEISNFDWQYIYSNKDIGFGILQKILKLLSNDPQFMVFSTALITNVLIVMVLYNYSRYLELSLYVYITGGLFLVSMNGIRQVLAASIFFTATKFLIEGDFKKYLMVILLASTFHQSALILIPIYFLVRFKAWSKASWILIFASIVIVAGFDKFSTVLFSAIEDTQYGHYENFHEGGANIMRVVVDAAPLFVAYLGRDKLRRIFPASDYIVNMSIIGFLFMIISTQNWIFARFSIYFGLYQLILISWIVKLFRKKDERFVYYAILICYFLYYFYENVVSLNIQYRSDYLIW